MVQKYRGVSLIETLLALAIMSLLITLGLRFMNALNKQNEVNVIGENVQTLLAAGADYYYANCNRKNTNGQFIFLQQGTEVLPVNIITDLELLQSNLAFSGTVDASSYALQYVPIFTPKTVSLGGGLAQTIGTISWWKMQASVRLLLDRSKPQDAARAERLRNMLRASCYTGEKGMVNGNKVMSTCAEVGAQQSNTNLNYLSWEEMPNQTKKRSASSFYWFMDNVRLFNQWSESYDRSVLMNNNDLSSQQYYSCGS